MWQIYPHHIEWQFHRFWFLFWQLIFCRPGVGDLTPSHRMAISQILIPILTAHIWQTRCSWSNLIPLNSNFTDFDSYSDSSYLADQVRQIYPHAIEWQFHRYWFLFWQLIFGQPGVADLPHVEQQFHRFWFLFWQLIFGRSGVADLLPPHSMAISQILIPIQTAHIWQTRCGRSTPTPVNSNFTEFDSYSDSSYLADQVWQIYPHPIEWQFHRFWFLFWQLIYGRPGVADLPSCHRMAISQILIPILKAHISPTRGGRSTPCKTAISQILIPTLRVHIWQTRCGRSTPVEMQFHRF